VSPSSPGQALFDAEGMRETDRWAIDDRGIPSLELMESAGRALADAAIELATGGPVRIVCGKGNNGGDGLVVARLLAEAGHEVDALLLWPAGELSKDGAANLARLTAPPRELGPDEISAALAGSGLIVDAIFGTGFSGAPREPALTAIEAINACEAPVLACDIASGVDASSGAVEGVAVDADVTVSFHAAKLGQRIAPGKRHAGELRVAAIGIPADAPSRAAGEEIPASLIASLPRRGADSTKFSSGQVLIVGGSRGLTGAVCMVAGAAIRAGAGYATVALPASLEPIVEAKLTEVMSVGLEERDGALAPEALDTVLERAERAACVVLGPGLGRSEGAQALACSLTERIEAPLLVDADGLKGLSEVSRRDAPTILTPHEGELGRLLGRDPGDVKAGRLACAREAVERSGAIVVLKGDDTIVCSAERIAVNALSSPALATAGTGDVLSGMIAGLLARGAEPFHAAAAAVLAHARAGNFAAERYGTESVIATDVIEAIPPGLVP
jgi:NAD(P)H-hydrate epimerase